MDRSARPVVTHRSTRRLRIRGRRPLVGPTQRHPHRGRASPRTHPARRCWRPPVPPPLCCDRRFTPTVTAAAPCGRLSSSTGWSRSVVEPRGPTPRGGAPRSTPPAAGRGHPACGPRSTIGAVADTAPPTRKGGRQVQRMRSRRRAGRHVWQVLAVLLAAAVLAAAAVQDLRVEVWLTTFSAVTAAAGLPRRGDRPAPGAAAPCPLAGSPVGPAHVSRRSAGRNPRYAFDADARDPAGRRRALTRTSRQAEKTTGDDGGRRGRLRPHSHARPSPSPSRSSYQGYSGSTPRT